MKSDILKPGHYRVWVKIEGSYEVEEDETITEGDAISDIRKNGEMVDWEVEEE